MNRIFKAVGQFLYRISGLQALVSALESFVLHYKLRVRMVPVSYKLFILILGMTIGGSTVYVHFVAPELVAALKKESVAGVYVNHALASAAPEKKESQVSWVDETADYIWMKESTRGKKNFSECENLGKINGVGYRIPGNGSYVCFDSHDDEMIVLKGWLLDKQAMGWSKLKMLCAYSGSHYDECKK